MYPNINQGSAREVTLSFKIKGQSVIALRLWCPTNYWLYRVYFMMYLGMINHGEQNMTLTFKLKGQGHSLNVIKSQYHPNRWYQGVDFDM